MTDRHHVEWLMTLMVRPTKADASARRTPPVDRAEV